MQADRQQAALLRREAKIMKLNLCACGCGGLTRWKWCHGHHSIARQRPAAERFWDHVEFTSACWLWTGRMGGSGYGYFEDGPAHRWSYEFCVGPIPEGIELDHTCHKPESCLGGPTCPHRRCINPDHLEPVTGAENTRRAGPATKTHCVHGHLYDEANTVRSGKGRRVCRECRRLGLQALRLRMRDGQAADSPS